MASRNENIAVVYKLRDRNSKLVSTWTEYFEKYPEHKIQISHGDIFKGAPHADAIVSPANSFGFMDGGIDMVYSLHFGWQMQERLQKHIREEYDGELLVGNAIIIPAYRTADLEERDERLDGCNDGKRIKYLISVPTMRVPLEVHDTANAYLAFRAVILAVKKHNADPHNDPITSVLCPGLGTAVGRMPPDRCAFQMLQAYRMYELGELQHLREPGGLDTVWENHYTLANHKMNVEEPKGKKNKTPKDKESTKSSDNTEHDDDDDNHSDDSDDNDDNDKETRQSPERRELPV